jgi:group I intron endonuclease
MYIYKTTNVLDGKFYIGKSVRNPKESLNYLGSGVYLKNAIHLYGKENFQKEILFETDNADELNEMEQFYIEKCNATNRSFAYNIAKGGEGGDTISNHPEKERIAKNYSEWNKSYWTDDKCKERSEKYSGNGNPFYNRTHTNETKELISNTKTGVPQTGESNKKRSETLKTRIKEGLVLNAWTDDARAKSSKSHEGLTHSQITKDKIRESVTGENNPSAKTWIFEHLDGKVIEVTGGFGKFCNDNNLSCKAMRNIANGVRKDKFYNNWTVKRKEK